MAAKFIWRAWWACIFCLVTQSPVFGQVTVTWDPSPGATGYRVSYGTDSRAIASYSATVDVGNVTSWRFTPPSTIETYYFSVVAYNSDGTSGFSNEAILEPTGWVPAPPASGDLNQDGRIDLIWHNRATGALAGWFMQSTTMSSAALLNAEPVTDTNWRVAATADLNADGELDLIWQHSTGRLACWLMNGTRFVSAGSITPGQVSDPEWQLSAATDLTGDGRPDFIWKHRSQGYLSLWEMNGTRMVAGRAINPGRLNDPNWIIVGTGDFDQDGTNDIVWQNATTGLATVWLMQGTTMRSPGLLRPNGVSDLAWVLKAVLDLNGDTKPDMVWQHRDGYIAAWLMNRLDLIRSSLLNPSRLSDLNWVLVGPR